MPTLDIPVENNRVLLRVIVAVPSKNGHSEQYEYEALVDTGAQCTMVSQKVVDEVGATKIGVRQFLPASGQPQKTAVFELSVGAVFSQARPDGSPYFSFSKGGVVPVLLLPYHPRDYDVLLGMDILTKYHITMWDGTFVLSI